jgi:hypothetical protein
MDHVDDCRHRVLVGDFVQALTPGRPAMKGEFAVALDVDPDCRLFCFRCGRDLGEKSPLIEAVVICEDCSKDDRRRSIGRDAEGMVEAQEGARAPRPRASP